MTDSAETAAGRESEAKASVNASWNIDDCIAQLLTKNDVAGARAVLEFEREALGADPGAAPADAAPADQRRAHNLMWLAYCRFLSGAVEAALELYEEAEREGIAPDAAPLYAVICRHYLGQHKEAQRAVQDLPPSDDAEVEQLRNRLQFFISQALDDETALMKAHGKLKDTTMDQLALAAMHYQREHYQEAVDIYKRLLLEDKKLLVLNLLISKCYYKLDYFDVALEILEPYEQAYPHSFAATNLRAACQFRLYNGKAALGELSTFWDRSVLTRHNRVVYNEGKGALRVLQPLVRAQEERRWGDESGPVLREARVNLALFHMKNGDAQPAYEMLKALEPKSPAEYICKGVASVMMGQETGSKEHLKKAQQYFQLVGQSESEKDTIPGRQCMASCFMLLKQFDDACVYLKSIESYLANDDTFNWNYGFSLLAGGEFEQAAERLGRVKDEAWRAEDAFVQASARCCVRNRDPRRAWEMYLAADTAQVSHSCLQLIGDECYATGQFEYALKAFDALLRIDSDESRYLEALRGAAGGVLQQVLARELPRSTLNELVLPILRRHETAHGAGVDEVILAIVQADTELEDKESKGAGVEGKVEVEVEE
eukprot:g5185.t1